MRVGLGTMRIPRNEFWKLTFQEFWAMYDGQFGKQEEPMTKSRFEEMKTKDLERSKRNGKS
jgi:uncharacterized phage protein (TIGR02216 family)